MQQGYQKIEASGISVPLKVTKGHFATNHSHTNYYIDLTTIKARASEAHSVARKLVEQYLFGMVVDTIICDEGTEVVGAFIAEELTKEGYINTNAHKTIYIVKPEFNTNSQIIFRDNIKPMIKGKNILIVEGSVSTGKTINKVMEAVKYYGGKLSGVSAIFSAITSYNGVPVVSVYGLNELPDYVYNDYNDCPFCKAGQPIDGLVNSFGVSMI
ncbi:orotate phosphoribosyltransferase [Oribacterium sp. C9]|uniref:phosphoribosyltransferase family protein n=1 Tax=Oribacterium sp. C9 TaxID=1943579 RepID=UPI00098F9406|nr:orotate phosphoribosyltransferase [Oribacterium sp. C9]